MKTIPFVANWLKVGSKNLVVDNKSIDNLVEINLYKNTAESNRVDKTNYLEEVGAFFGVFRDDSSIVDVSIMVELDSLPEFNYVKISKLNRYYFVTDVTAISNKLWQIDMQCDVLMSYKEAIKNLTAFVDRNENTYDEELIDKNRVIKQGVDIEAIDVPNDVTTHFNKERFCWVLTGFNLTNSNTPIPPEEG